jgi:oligosaccharide repeat unit polymerase
MKVVGGPERPLMLLAAASGLLLAALLEGIFLSAHAGEAILATLLGIPAGWLVVRFALRMKTVKIDVFSPLVAFPVAYVLWFGLGSLTFLLDANPPRYLYFVLGLLAYLAGTLVIVRRGTGVRGVWGPPERIPWNASYFRFMMLVFFLLMAGSYLLLIAQIGIPGIHADVLFQREALGLHHYLLNAIESSALTLMFFAAADLWSVERVLSPFVSGGMLGLGTLMLSSLGNRGFLVAPVLTLLVLRHYWKKAIPAKRLMVIFVVMFVVSVAYDYARARAITNKVGDGAWNEVLFSSGAFTLYTSLSNFRDVVQAIPTEVPYQHGYLTFGALLQVLPGHHESSDEFFKRILANDFVGGGQPGSLLAPFYGDFGLMGILVGMFLFGAFSAKVYGWMGKKPSLLRMLLYSWTVQTALFSLYGALVTYISTLWLPFLWWILHRWMSSAPEAIEGGSHRRVRALRPA